MIIRESFSLSPENIYLPSGRCIKDELSTGGTLPCSAPDTLLVKVAGTHGGFVNKNGFFYKQSGMSVSYHTWTRPFPKAVLINHAEYGDSIGRVIDARFSLDSPDYYKTNFGITSNIPTCHIDLILSLTNQDAIEKVMRGEYLTVSQSSVCLDITCSACGADILSEERCDHMRNSKFDEKRIYWIFGVMNYNEISFVNVPSDEFATIESFGEEKEEVMDTWSSDTVGYGTLVIMDSFKDTSMPKEKPKKADPKECENEDYSTEDKEMLEKLELDVDVFFDILSDVLPDGIVDKKLSAAERKALPASAFCGPERSFPVNDCGHVMAAKARLKGYKGSGSKTKILACINAAAKRLKCFKEEDQITLENFLDGMGISDSFLTKSEHETAVEAIRDELNKKIEALETANVEATEKVTTLETEGKDNLAEHVANLRQAMGGINAERYEAVLVELKGRSEDSLRDTLKDLREEIGEKDLGSVSDPAAGKLKDTIPKPSDPPATREFTNRKDAVEHLFRGNTKKQE